jgi:hypothetical protein
MSDDKWSAIALLLERGFKWSEPFAGAHERVYRTLLDGYDETQIAAAIRRLVTAGQVFGPTPGEIVRAIEADAYRPTFIEAFSAIYELRPVCGGRGVLRTRGGNGTSDRDARLDRAYEIHPLLGAFVQAYGLDRLEMLEVDHDEKAAVIRRQLEQTWDRFAEANEHRDAAALANGRRRELARGPKRLDFRHVLDVEPDTKQGELLA